VSSSLDFRLLVTGAAGHFGRRVVDILLEKGATRVVAGSRDPQKVADLAARGATAVEVDFDDPASLDAAFAGVDRVLIVSTDAIAVPGQRQRQHKTAVAAAAKAGVSHIVYTSMPNPEPGSLIPFAPDHYETEQAIERSGIPFTILRNNWYMENLVGSLPQVIASGQWFTSAADGRTGFVAREDTAQAAASALLAAGSGRARYDITGPEALTKAEIAELASDVTGRPISVVQVSDDQLAAGLASAGLPQFVITLLVGIDANTRAGGLATCSDAVQRLTGRAPQSLKQFLTAHREALLGAQV
jgi:NAD(P)H dehydrogenase (quinone)